MQNIEHKLIEGAEDAVSDFDHYEEQPPSEVGSKEGLGDDLTVSETGRLTAELEELKKRLEEQQCAALEMAREATADAFRASRQQRELEEARAQAEKARFEATEIRSQAAAAAQMATVEMLRIETEYSRSKRKAPRYWPADQQTKKVGSGYSSNKAEVERAAIRQPKNGLHSWKYKLALHTVALLSFSAVVTAITFVALARQSRDTQKADNSVRIRLAPAKKVTESSNSGADEMARALERSPVEGLEPNDANPDSPFYQSVDRLSRAFDSFPDKQPSDIVNEINGPRSAGSMACPMEWNTAGEPAFLLGGAQPRVSIIRVIEQCASLVEEYRSKTLKNSR